MIGDTSSSARLFSDEELKALITTYGSASAAAIAAAKSLAAKYSGEADKWVGDLKILASQKSKAFAALAVALAKASVAQGVPSSGGIRTSEKESMESNTDRIAPAFTRNMFPYDGDC